MTHKELEHKPKSCWEAFDGESDRQAMEALADLYLAFLSECKTEREVVEYVRQRAQEAGYSEDFSSDKVFRVFKGKTIFLARKGTGPLSAGLRFFGAHGDSPRLDFKQHPLYESCGVGQAKTHYYGGIRKHHWFSRPLALHGVIVKKDGEVVQVRLGEDDNDPVFAIADLLPHLAYKQADQPLSKAFEAEKMNIILGHEPLKSEDSEAQEAKDGESNGESNGKIKDPVKARLLELLYERYGIMEEDLFSAELQAVPAGKARYVGLDRALLGGYAHDDRICVFTGLEAMLSAEQGEHTQVLLIWDKEEIGSEGSTGAKSLFFEYCIEDLLKAWEPETSLRRVMLETKAVSADVHGGLDPDYQEVHEKLNSALLGYGPCFCKFTGHRGKVAANDAHPEYVGWLRSVLDKAGVPWQMAELGKVDEGGGGTVAKYLAVYGMDIIDMGPAILAMHSPFEIASKADLYATMRAYKAILES